MHWKTKNVLCVHQLGAFDLPIILAWACVYVNAARTELVIAPFGGQQV